MYWIYLSIFVLAVLTPEIIQEGRFLLGEEDLESLLVLFFGTFGIAVYFIKEKALLRLFKERLRLQKQANVITKDLSDSYSYIGEMNRRIDIVRDLVFRLPEEIAAALADKQMRKQGAYRSVLEAARLLSKSDSVALRFIDTASGKIVLQMNDGDDSSEACFSDSQAIDPKKTFHEEEGCVMIRSPRSVSGIAAFIIFPKSANRIEDTDMLRMVASEALSIYCFGGSVTSEHTER